MSTTTTAHDESAAAARAPRADATRNRARLLEAATAAFSENAGEVSLEDVARRAGVGIGTLYRHFPTREELVLEVYRHQVESLEERSRTLPTQLPPGEALHEWMRNFVDYYAVKLGMVNLLRSMMVDRPEVFASVRELMQQAAGQALAPAVEAGVVRADITGEALLRALGGICLASTTPDGQSTSLAVVDLVYDGLRFGAEPAPRSR